jgi:hypothetical protein
VIFLSTFALYTLEDRSDALGRTPPRIAERPKAAHREKDSSGKFTDGLRESATVTLAQAGIDKNLAYRAAPSACGAIKAPKKRKGPPFGSPFDSRLYRTLGRRPGSVTLGVARSEPPNENAKRTYHHTWHQDTRDLIYARSQHSGSEVPRSKAPSLRTGAPLTPRCRIHTQRSGRRRLHSHRVRWTVTNYLLVFFDHTVGKPQHDLQWTRSPRASDM